MAMIEGAVNSGKESAKHVASSDETRAVHSATRVLVKPCAGTVCSHGATSKTHVGNDEHDKSSKKLRE